MSIDASLWVFLAFVTFILLVGKRGWQALRTFLDQRSCRIQQEMQEAHQLYKAAQEGFNAKQQMETQIHLQAQEMTVLMNDQIDHFRRQATLDINTFYQQEQRFFKQRLDLMERNYIQNLKTQILQRAFHLSYDILQTDIEQSMNAARIQKNKLEENKSREDQLFDDALTALDNFSISKRRESLSL